MAKMLSQSAKTSGPTAGFNALGGATRPVAPPPRPAAPVFRPPSAVAPTPAPVSAPRPAPRPSSTPAQQPVSAVPTPTMGPVDTPPSVQAMNEVTPPVMTDVRASMPQPDEIGEAAAPPMLPMSLPEQMSDPGMQGSLFGALRQSMGQRLYPQSVAALSRKAY